MKLIGLCGAHRVGKTTLMHAVAAELGIEGIEVSISSMQKELGFDSSNQSYSFETRMMIQTHLLNKFTSLLEGINAAGLPAITDRTPNDLIGYMLINVGEKESKDHSDWIMKYIESCLALTSKHYSDVFLIQPGIVLETNNTSAHASMGLIEHLHAIYSGYINRLDLDVNALVMSKDIVDLDERVKYIWSNIND